MRRVTRVLSQEARPIPLAVTLLCAVPALAGEGVAAPAREQPASEGETSRDHRLVFRAEWRRFELVDYVTTALVGGAFLAVQRFAESPEEPRWTGPILFDRAARDAFVGGSRRVRDDAGIASDVLWYTPMLLPFVESALVPLAFDGGNFDVAWQLSMMNLQAGAANALLTRSGHRFVARQRPDAPQCEADPEYGEKCFNAETSSFPSGHSSSAFLGAGLACAHHASLPLYGGGAPDVAVCAATATMALANGVTRLVADRHYATDVVAGLLIGGGTGFGMPLLLHYGGLGSFREAGVGFLVTPVASRDTVGGVASGIF